MPKKEVPARLHPRLRMLRNGGETVNGWRSSISMTVASAGVPSPADVAASKQARPAKAAAAGLSEMARRAARDLLVEAQQSAPSLARLPYDDVSGSRPTGGRAKMTETEPANGSYVNVFVEVSPDLASRREGESAELMRAIGERISAACRVGQGDVPVTIVPRGNLVSATVPVSALPVLEADEELGFVAPAEPLKLDVPDPAEASGQPPSRRVRAKRAIHKNGEEVLIGIVDVGGFDFAHRDFLDEADNTRFIAIWDQGGSFRPPPEKYGYGAEFTASHLRHAVQQAGKPGGFPATAFERQSQMEESSHGTHVASIAAGRKGVCPAAKIAAVLVDVPQAADDEARRRFTFSDSSRVAHAVEYLLDIAKRERKSISINVSLGTNGGAHDGSSGVSRWIDHALTTPGRAVSLAAGNAGQEAAEGPSDVGWTMGRIHTSGRIASRGLEVELEWAVVGNGLVDVSENELEIWYSPQDRFIASVQPPGETRWYTAGPGEFIENKRLSSGTHLSIFNELYHHGNGSNYIAIYLSPNLDPEHFRGVEAGLWKVRLRGEEVRNGAFHAWIERDDPVEIGRFGDERFVRFPSFFSERTNVDSHSISSLACGANVVGVANVDEATGRVNVSSSQGPTRDGRPKPDVIAPGTGIIAANGFASDGKRWVSMTGTSMASPYVAGVIGLMLAVNPDLTSAQCAGILQRTAQPLPGLSFEWQSDSGFGRIDAEAAVAEASRFTTRVEVSGN